MCLRDRFEIHYEDALAFLKNYSGEPFDVVIMDISDPIECGPGIELYFKGFYEMLARDKMSEGADRFSQTWPMDVELVSVQSDSASLELGRFIAESHGCQGRHTADFSGQIMADAPPFLMVAPNLTSGAGGSGATFSDEDWVRAI